MPVPQPTSWYTQQYNALRNAQIQETALADALHRENIGERIFQTKAAAQRNLEAVSEFNRQRLVQEYADNENQLKFGREQIERNKVEIARKYADIEIPNGKGGYISVPSEFSKAQSGQLAVSKGASPTVSSQSMQSAYAPTKTASPVIEADFSRSNSPVEQVRQSNSQPQSAPSANGVGRQVATGALSVAGGFVGDYVGDRASEAVFGQSNGIGSQVFGVIGSVVGGIAGGSVAGASTLGLGTIAGGIAGSTGGAALGSVIGSGLDALGSFLFGDKPKPKASNQIGQNHQNTGNYPAPTFNANDKADGWYRVYITAGFPNGFTLKEDASEGGLNANTAYSWQYDGAPPTSVIRISVNGVLGNPAGADGTNIFDVRWYFVSNGFLAKAYPASLLPPTPANAPYIPSNPVDPKNDFGEIDVLGFGEKYKQGTAYVDPKTRRPQTEPDELKSNGVRAIDPSQLNKPVSNSPNNIGTSPTSDRREATAKPSNSTPASSTSPSNPASSLPNAEKVTTSKSTNTPNLQPVKEPVKDLSKPRENTPSSPDLGAIALGITGLGIATGTVLTGIDYLKGLNEQINNQTTPDAQRQNSKNGSCDALQSPSCTLPLKQSITDPINSKLDAAQVARDVNAGTQTAALGGIAAAIANLTKLVGSLYNNQFVQSTIHYLTLYTVLHNAAMLTRDIGETLGEMVDQGLTLAGRQFKDSEGQSVEFTELVGNNIRSLIIGAIGADNYASLTLKWQKASAIFNSATNVINTTQSMLDPLASAIEYGMENVSKIGNNLKEDGVVSENAYPAMDETIRARRVNRFSRLGDTLEGAENVTSNLSNVVSDAVSIKEDFKELRSEYKTGKDKIAEFQTTDTARIEAIKAAIPPQSQVSLQPAPDDDD